MEGRRFLLPFVILLGKGNNRLNKPNMLDMISGNNEKKCNFVVEKPKTCFGTHCELIGYE